MAKRAMKSPDPNPLDGGGADRAADPARQTDPERIFCDYEAASSRLIEYISRKIMESEFDWDDVDSDPGIDDEADLKESNKQINAVIRTLEVIKKFQNQRLRIIKDFKDSFRSGHRDG